MWPLAVAALVVAGSSGVVLVGLGWHRQIQRENRAVVSQEADNVAGRLSATLARYSGLAEATAALPPGSLDYAQFQTFGARIGLTTNYPGVIDVGFLSYVRAPDLDGFLAAERASGLPAFTVSPAGARPYYCVVGTGAGATVAPNSVPLLGLDGCTYPYVQRALFASAQSATPVIIPGSELGKAFGSVFFLVVPAYVSEVPDTPNARMAALRGWGGILASGQTLLSSAITDRSLDVSLALYNGPLAEPAALVAGGGNTSLPVGARSVATRTFESGATWTIRIFVGSRFPGLASPWAAPTGLLVGGFLLVLALAALVGLLGRSRRFALLDARSAHLSLRESELRFAAIAQFSPVGIIETDSKLRITYVNRRLEEITGLPAESLLGGWFTGVHPEDLERLEEHFVAVTEGKLVPNSLSFRLVRPGGAIRHLRSTWARIPSGSDPGSSLVLTVEDITDELAAEERLRSQALHDALTGLPNRLLLLDRLEVALHQADRAHTQVAVLFLDLDRFKVVNDSLGHKAGDILLTSVARRLEETARASDTLARLGGDEFVLLLPEVRGVDEAVIVAERVLDCLREPFTVLDQEVFAGASIGIVLPDASSSPDAVLRDADAAMYRAKDNGRGGYSIFQPGMHSRSLERLVLESELRAGLEHGELIAFYQPVVDLRSGEPASAEALVRWRHPSRGLLAPAEFIPLAEETGLVVPLGQRVFADAMAQLDAWDHDPEGPSVERLSVNVSTKQLRDPDAVREMQRVVEVMGLDPGRIVLEITEATAMSEDAGTRESLRLIAEAGLLVAVDDFGTGYSSLATLRTLPAMELKIDRSFVDALGTASEADDLVLGIVDIGHHLGLQVLAEGVETEAQRQKLVAFGCDRAQGFLWSPPLPPEELAAWWRTQHSRPAEARMRRPA